MSRFLKFAVVLAVIAVIAVGSLAFAEKKGGADCPKDFDCPTVWEPVLCADGLVYGNLCEARQLCAQLPCVLQ